jgi:hypothetical protein
LINLRNYLKAKFKILNNMEGVKRIIISLDGENILTKRAPLSYTDFKLLLKKLHLPITDSFTVKIGSRTAKIADDASYKKYLKSSGFEGLIVDFNTDLYEDSSDKVPAQPVLPAKRQKSSGPLSPKPKKAPKPSKKPAPKAKKQSPSPSKHRKKSPFPAQPSAAIVSPPTNPPTKIFSNASSLFSQPNSQSTLFSPPNQPLFPSTTSSLFPQLQPHSSSTLFSPSNQPQSLFPNLSSTLFTPDLSNCAATIPIQGELKLIEYPSFRSQTIKNLTTKLSSRMLLIDDGILITGGSGAPYQALLLSKDLTVKPLVSMNCPRFWHCTGFIDGFPAVVAGAERSTLPKVFVNTVEIYKDGCWQRYPDTNFRRCSASMCSSGQFTYVAGGVITDGRENTIVKDIERWDGVSWEVLNLKMPSSVLAAGCIVSGVNELLFVGGGVGNKNSFTDQVYVLNLESAEVRRLEKLKRQTKFTYGQGKIIGNNAVLFDHFGECYEINLLAMTS